MFIKCVKYHALIKIGLIVVLIESCSSPVSNRLREQNIDSSKVVVSVAKKVSAVRPPINYNATKNIQFYTTEQGLSNGNVKDLTEDRYGNIWFATNKGINKYNGQTFTHYLTQMETWSLCFDDQGHLWIGTFKNGIIEFDGQRFLRYDERDGILAKNIRVIYKGHDGKMWFGTEQGVYFYKDRVFNHVDLKQKGTGNSVTDIYEDRLHNIWICTFGSGVFKLANNMLTQYEVKAENMEKRTIIANIHSNKFHSVLEDKNGELWFGARFEGLFTLKNNTLVSRFSDPKLNSICPKDMILDQSGNVWLSHSNGLTKYDYKKWNNITSKDGLGLSISSGNLLYDSGGNLWLSMLNGINKYSENAFQYCTSYHIEHEEVPIYDIVEDSLGKFWACTFQKIVVFDSALNPLNDLVLTKNLPRVERYFTSMILENKNTLWVTSFGGGISRVNTITGKHETFSYFGPTRSNKFFTSSYKDMSGDLWFGGLEGLVQFDGQAFKNYNAGNGLKNDEVNCLGEDHQKRIWVGSETGISIYDGTSFYEIPDFRNISITSILKSKKEHEMIIGTTFFGLWVYHTKTQLIKKYTQEHGLSSNSISSLLYDHRQNIWVGTDNGINIMLENISEKGEVQFRSFLEEEGFVSKNCEINAVVLSGNKMIWGTEKNITLCYLDRVLLRKNTKPKLTLEDIKLFYKNVSWTSEDVYGKNITFNYVDAWTNVPYGLTLPYTENHITFSFIAIDWKYPDNISYKFKLEGVDKNWSSATYKNEVIYSALQPGKYLFKVLAINKNNNQSDVIEYAFTITPPFWKTPWFIASIVVCIITIIMIYIKNRERVLRIRQKELEQVVEKRTQELKQEKLIVEKQNRNIRESIEYAKRIQETILPPPNFIEQLLPDSFVLFKPKDIVSGDFYWIKRIGDDLLFTVVDCTGHGVPGAFMSIIGHNLLEKIILEQKITSPDLILNALNQQLIDYLRQDDVNNEIKDGMNLALCKINLTNKTLHFSGSYNPLYLIRDRNITILKGDKIPIGKSFLHDQMSFQKDTIQLQKNDVIYLFSDGIADQKGGVDQKKFFYSRFRELLVNISTLPMEKQKQKIENALHAWKGNLDQTDDICIIGVRI